jgi:hypothetical protein
MTNLAPKDANKDSMQKRKRVQKSINQLRQVLISIVMDHYERLNVIPRGSRNRNLLNAILIRM